MNTIYAITAANVASEDAQRQAAGHWAMEIIWDRVFDGRMQDRAHVISVFNAHNQHVIDTVPESKLLVFEAKHGWAPLCEFLEVNIPEQDYPRTNSTEEFQQFLQNS